jgi:hypothetical protein
MTSRWQHLRRDFATSLRAEGKSPNTLRLYLRAVDKLEKWCLFRRRCISWGEAVGRR